MLQSLQRFVTVTRNRPCNTWQTRVPTINLTVAFRRSTKLEKKPLSGSNEHRQCSANDNILQFFSARHSCGGLSVSQRSHTKWGPGRTPSASLIFCAFWNNILEVQLYDIWRQWGTCAKTKGKLVVYEKKYNLGFSEDPLGILRVKFWFCIRVLQNRWVCARAQNLNACPPLLQTKR